GIMQPQCTHNGHSGKRPLMHNAVQIRQHAVAQLEVLAANRLDLRIVQFAGIRESRSFVPTNFGGTCLARVPAPRQAELPGAPVAAEKCAESSELEPTQIQLGGKLLCWNEAADVRAPVRNPGESRIDGDGNVRL